MNERSTQANAWVGSFVRNEWPALPARGVDFAQTSSLTAQRTQIIQLGATHVGRTQHVDLIDDLRVRREDTLNTLAEAHLADGEAGLRALALGDDHAFERLQTLLIAFLDFHLHANGVAGLEVGEIRAPRLGE